MDRLCVVKLSPSVVRFAEDFMMYFGSSYDVWCEAKDFRADGASEATLSVETAGEILASCSLSADPQRRGVRRGTLSLSGLSYPSGRYWLCAKLAGNVVFRVEVMAFSVAGSEASPSGRDGRWTVVDLGVVNSATVTVADMTQVKLASQNTVAPLNILATAEPFEAYVAVTSLDGGFPFSDVLVNGASPVWDHKDSMQLGSYEWTVHVMKIAGVFHAELRSGRAAGAETDPDGNLVNSMEVNS